MPQVQLLLGDCIERMAEIPEASIDAIVTDPPYEMAFMGRKWDATGVAFRPETWAECLRLLKPGGHLLAFGGSRTYHRMAVAIEDVGFEVRDCIMWIYGTGKPASSTRLKPAYEPILVARKPCQGTEAANVRKWGTGGIQVEACRIPLGDEPNPRGSGDRRDSSVYAQDEWSKTQYFNGGNNTPDSGRWPANLIHDGNDEATAGFPITAPSKSGGISTKMLGRHNDDDWAAKTVIRTGHNDSGSAARYFYCAKANKADRGEGNDHPTVKPASLMRYLTRLVTPPGGIILDPFMGSGSTGKAALAEGFEFIGIERDNGYFAIAQARIDIV